MLSRRDILTGLAVLPATSLLPSFAAFAEPTPAQRLVKAARAQIGVTTLYDGAYARIAYPGGDVDIERGVCCDVIIRAYRAGLKLDLQKLVHEDMVRHFAAYPANWGLAHPDSNIDHRRVPNLATFFRRKGAALARDAKLQPGDIVTMMLPGNLPHILLVSDMSDRQTRLPLFIHNIGGGTELSLADYPVTGRYRYLPNA